MHQLSYHVVFCLNNIWCSTTEDQLNPKRTLFFERLEAEECAVVPECGAALVGWTGDWQHPWGCLFSFFFLSEWHFYPLMSHLPGLIETVSGIQPWAFSSSSALRTRRLAFVVAACMVLWLYHNTSSIQVHVTPDWLHNYVCHIIHHKIFYMPRYTSQNVPINVYSIDIDWIDLHFFLYFFAYFCPFFIRKICGVLYPLLLFFTAITMRFFDKL